MDKPIPAEMEAEVQKLEDKLQGLLISLSEFAMRSIDRVDVDTRNFANYKVEIYFKDCR